jgi:hypothetical protein
MRCGQFFRPLDDAPCSQDRTRIITNGDQFSQPIFPVGGDFYKNVTHPIQPTGSFNCPNLERARLRLAAFVRRETSNFEQTRQKQNNY